MTDVGNQVQMRAAAEQIAEATIAKFVMDHPELQKSAEIPAPLKWAATIVTTLLTGGFAGMGLWIVSTVNDMQVTLARMDERQQSMDKAQGVQYQELNRRVTSLEAYHAGEKK